VSIRYDLPRGQFFDEEHRYVNPDTVAEKLRQAEADLAQWQEMYREMMHSAESLKDRLDAVTKQRDRAEQKYDALLVQLPKSTDYEFEVFDAEDGMPGLRMVSYKDRAEQLEERVRELEAKYEPR